MREVEKKINLENAHYEELMPELQLNKKSTTGNGVPPGISAADGHSGGYGPGGLGTTALSSASHVALNGGLNGLNGGPPGLNGVGHAAISTAAAVTTVSSGYRPPLGQITQASLEGYMTDTSSVLGGHQPLITISQPNGKKGTTTNFISPEANYNKDILDRDTLYVSRIVL